MLTELLREVHARYSSLPVLGPIVDGFAEWLLGQGYTRPRIRRLVRSAGRADLALRRRGCGSLRDITREALSACLPKHARDDPDLASTLRLRVRYPDTKTVFPMPRPSQKESLLAEYGTYLEAVRGLAPTLVKKRLHPHSMRHSTAVHLRQAGVDTTTISHWLGHASVNTTNRYATVDLQMKREAIAKASPFTDHPPAATWRTDHTILDWLEALGSDSKPPPTLLRSVKSGDRRAGRGVSRGRGSSGT